MRHFPGILCAFAMAVAFSACSTPPQAPKPAVHELLRSSHSWDGAAIAYPDGTPEIVGHVIEIPPGGETGWHAHPVPVFGYSLQGTLVVTLEDGRTKRVGAGEMLLEVSNTLHNGRNVGADMARIVVFYASTPGGPTTVRPKP